MTIRERIMMFLRSNPEMALGIVFVLLFTVSSYLVTKPFFSKKDSLPVLTESEFTQVLKESDRTVLIEFFAPWCGPCRIQGSILQEYADTHTDAVTVAKVNVDESTTLANRFSISAIPTLIVFRDGQETARGSGLHDTEQLNGLLNKR